MIIPNIWSGGLFLQENFLRDRLERHIRERIRATDFFLWKFCLDGLRHSWASSEVRDSRPFRSSLGESQETVPGVSENLYRAEGVMHLPLWNLQEMGIAESDQRMYRFTG